MAELLDAALAALSPAGLAFMLAVVALAGFLRGFVGFGASLMIVLALSQIVGPATAAPVACLAGLPVMLQLLPVAIRRSERPFVLPLGLACFAAAPFGTWLLATADPDALRIAISLAVLAMVAAMRRGWRPARTPGPAALAAVGVAAGLAQGVAAIGGPAAVVAALARGGPPERQRANVIGAVAALNLCAVAPLAWHGLFDFRVAAIGVFLIPPYIAASWLGARFFSAAGHRHYRDAALAVLALAGAVTLVIAARDYLAG